MSVTITIRGNLSFLISNDPTKIRYTECCYCEDQDAATRNQCECCSGTGKLALDSEQELALNLSNANFTRLWNDLGLPSSEDGQIDSRVLRSRLGNPEYSVRNDVDNRRAGEARELIGGIRPDQEERYHSKLMEICVEAERRESLIDWH